MKATFVGQCKGGDLPEIGLVRNHTYVIDKGFTVLFGV